MLFLCIKLNPHIENQEVMNDTDIWIINGDVLTDMGFQKKHIYIKNGIVQKITEEVPETRHNCYDAKGCVVLPSFIDMHVHLREPGFSYKETIKTGTLAAKEGGFSCVCSMPNLNPAPDNIDHLKEQLDIIERDAVIKVLPYATITKGRSGKQLVDYKALAPFVAGFSDDGSGVQDEEVMRKAMEEIAETGKILAAHCEVESLLKGGYIHDGLYAKEHSHRGINSESEWKEVERDIRLSEETGCRLHVCHISTKESVELIRNAKEKGIKVTCETGPHYLTFCDRDLQEHGRFKMNPPIRSKEDQEALRDGLIDGTIDVVATDHAPHSDEEKLKGLEKSAMGVVGLETAFAAVYTTMVKSGLMSFERLIESMAITPRKILGLPVISSIKEGGKAELTVINLNEKYKVKGTDFKSKGHFTPYEGMELFGKVKLTLI